LHQSNGLTVFLFFNPTVKYLKKHTHKSTDKLFTVFSTLYLTNYSTKDVILAI